MRTVLVSIIVFQGAQHNLNKPLLLMTPTAVAVVIMLLTCAQLVFVLDFLLLNTCVGLLYVPYIL